MKKFLSILFSLILFSTLVYSQATVKVTIRANTATVPDTLKSNSYVQLRGGADAFGNWSSAGPLLTNVGGDYWEITLNLTPGVTIPYKFFTNAFDVDGNGWEQDIDPSGNREVVVPSQDIVLPVQFVNGTPTRQLQNFTPFGNIPSDQVAIMFRVNMQGREGFNKATQFVAVRGGFPASGGDWSRNFLLTREQQHGNGGSQNYDGTNFWSGVTTIPKSEIGKTIEYKFVILNSNSTTADVANWEDIGNRSFVVGGDTTLYWKWWENKAPVPFQGTDTVIVSYRTDLSTAIRSRGFTTGDTIQVQSGWSSSASDLRGESPSKKTLTKTGITGNLYTLTDTLVGQIGAPMYYQYYLIKNGSDQREVFFNFDYKGTENNLAERRSIILQRTNNVFDTINSVTSSSRQPDFRNNQRLNRNVTVKLVCDLRPAYYTLLAGGELESGQGGVVTLTKNDAERLYSELGVWVNGGMTGGWTEWGGSLRDSLSKKMYDDGTHGDDVAGDRKYTAIIELGPNSTVSDQRTVGQEFKFGIYGGDNESGFGLNHIENIDDSQSTFTLNIQFGSINPGRYFGWNFNTQQPISVNKLDVVPSTYSLLQNYPNPFNPSTIISYDILKSGNVSLKVYDIMGREVATLVNEVQAIGRYEVVFAAKNLSSGVYFYHLTAGDFTAIKKMVLMK